MQRYAELVQLVKGLSGMKVETELAFCSLAFCSCWAFSRSRLFGPRKSLIDHVLVHLMSQKFFALRPTWAVLSGPTDADGRSVHAESKERQIFALLYGVQVKKVPNQCPGKNKNLLLSTCATSPTSRFKIVFRFIPPPTAARKADVRFLKSQVYRSFVDMFPLGHHGSLTLPLQRERSSFHDKCASPPCF